MQKTLESLGLEIISKGPKLRSRIKGHVRRALGTSRARQGEKTWHGAYNPAGDDRCSTQHAPLHKQMFALINPSLDKF